MSRNIRRRDLGRHAATGFGLVAAGIGLAAAWFLAVSLRAQTPSQAPIQNGNRTINRTISGVVVNAKTGQPIAEATVTLRNSADFKIAAETATDGEGRFAFQNLGDGRFNLRAARRGYVSAAFEEHGSVSTAIVTGEGLRSTGLRLKLDPQAAIFGAISEDSGDPVPQAHITLYRQDQRQGTGKMVRAHTINADAMGNFELGHLAPGSYYLCASGTPWYATRNPTSGNLRDGPSAETPRSPLDVAYPITCFPGVTDASAAEPILVGAGDRVPINLVLHAVQSVRILIQIPKPEGDRGIAMPALRSDLFGMPEFVQTGAYQSIDNPSDGGPMLSFEVSGVAPGQYEAEFRSPSGEVTRYGSVDATSDHASVVAPATAAAGGIAGKIAMAGGASLPAGVTVSFTTEPGGDGISARVDADGSFHTQALHPGDYDVRISAEGFSLAVTQLKATGAVVSGRQLKMGSEPVELNAVVAPAKATVNGSVTLGGNPASGIFVLMVPADPAAGREGWRPNQSDSDGSFSFPRVIPGDYTIVAIEHGWEVEWAKPEVIERYLAKGQKVSVARDAGKIDLKEPLIAQAK